MKDKFIERLEKVTEEVGKLNESIKHGKTLSDVPKEEWVGKIITVPGDADYEIVELDDENNRAILKNIENGTMARMKYNILKNPHGYMYYLKGTEVSETYTKNEALDDLRVELKELLSVAISDEYVDKIIDAIYDSVKSDVEENSAEADEGYHSVDDVRLAIGRELMDKYNLW